MNLSLFSGHCERCVRVIRLETSTTNNRSLEWGSGKRDISDIITVGVEGEEGG